MKDKQKKKMEQRAVERSADEAARKEQEIDKTKFQMFLDRLTKLGIAYQDKKTAYSYTTHKDETKTVSPFVELHWCTGGVHGGSCWDTGERDNHRAYTNDDPEPEFTALDTILEDVCPNITFLQYKTLAPKVMTFSTYTENEYYGNSRNYAVKTLDLRALYDLLVDRNLLKDQS